ncbi:sugar phosphate isomerase/epimerase family protein [Salinilacihabitans rarus]|uniref:sugar phosphate isomerase/epimerase family protein n=1 Tax=Salinilacihabitans rarus TaxID=2961596 RepID=UPI0020C895B5|nr:sugar phosphate isomerase/epimerase [Salinilacihabitans rarus]
MDVAVQLYSLRGLDRPTADLLDLVADTPASGVEFAGVDDPDAVADALDRTGLAPVAAHVLIDDPEADLAGVAETYRAIGCETVVVPWLDAEHFAEPAAVDAAADRLSRLADELAAYDLDLAYHNHDQEFTALADGDAFDRLAAGLDAGLELDVGWAVAAGRDPVALLDRHGDAVDLVHLKDVDGDRPCALGTGDVPLDACVDAARAADVEWSIYEHDEPADPEAALRRDVDRATALLE